MMIFMIMMHRVGDDNDWHDCKRWHLSAVYTLTFFFSLDEFQSRLGQLDVYMHFSQPDHVLINLYLVHLQWFGNLFKWRICASCFKIKMEWKIYFYRGSRYKQIMRYKVLLTIFLVGWISSEFGAIGLHTSITSGNLVTSLSSMWIWVNVYESDLWIFKQNFKVISFYQSSYGMK